MEKREKPWQHHVSKWLQSQRERKHSKELEREKRRSMQDLGRIYRNFSNHSFFLCCQLSFLIYFGQKYEWMQLSLSLHSTLCTFWHFFSVSICVVTTEIHHETKLNAASVLWHQIKGFLCNTASKLFVKGFKILQSQNRNSVSGSNRVASHLIWFDLLTPDHEVERSSKST